MTEQELMERDAGRDLGAELLEAVREMKAGRAARTTAVVVNPIAEARNKAGCSQSEFAKLLGVSPRTLQQWEQGRRQPTGAARTLIRIAMSHPEVLRA
ncbi:helix-turn-helix domain-containing protein [Laribacter hongkongensis]|uniref:helix-turn-helix domain-containing protein n=1 Tax=Laribacter hongkongensis TaxID=168471 RepID=UPI001EFD5F61|nr:helix-turn-helix domain-containing protein [Laribacter hongkongensis]MCG9065051.1 helix-turn-helix domain-containing protein [Laribacter hongkongensis]